MTNEAGKNMKELMPCPHCGFGSELGVIGDDECGWYIECFNCYATGGDAETRDGAIEEWNKRAERTCRIENTSGEWRCSCCGEVVGSDDPWCELFTNGNAIEMWNYCPACGAKVIAK